MKNYVDKFGHYHLKEVTESDPVPTNDGWTMTAFAKKLGMSIDTGLFFNTFIKCRNLYFNGASILRNPTNNLPPPSRDTVLGSSYLIHGYVHILVSYKWNFCPWEIPKFNPFLTVKSLYLCRKAMKTSKKPRNVVWNYPHLYRFAFSVPLTDRHTILKWAGKKSNLFYWLISFIDSKLPASSESSKFIRWLKYDTKLTKEDWIKRFGEEHVFCEGMK